MQEHIPRAHSPTPFQSRSCGREYQGVSAACICVAQYSWRSLGSQSPLPGSVIHCLTFHLLIKRAISLSKMEMCRFYLATCIDMLVRRSLASSFKQAFSLHSLQRFLHSYRSTAVAEGPRKGLQLHVSQLSYPILQSSREGMNSPQYSHTHATKCVECRTTCPLTYYPAIRPHTIQQIGI